MLKEIIESLESDWDFIPKKFIVEGGGVISQSDSSVSYDTDSPKEAIEKWVAFQKSHPSEINIHAKKGKYVKELYNWVFNNLDEFTEIIKKQKVYKWDHLLKEVQTVNVQKLDVRNSGIHPFTMG